MFKWSMVAMLIAFNLFFMGYGLQKHHAFQTAGYDLGIWDQKIWNMLHGRPFVITTQIEVNISLGDHVDPIISFLLLPIYSILPSPQTLIIFQVLWVSLGAIPMYALAKQKFGDELTGLLFAAVYLLFPALQSAVISDFHGTTIATPLLAVALWAMYQRRYHLFLVMSVLIMTCQEDMPLLPLMMAGGFLILDFGLGIGHKEMAKSPIQNPKSKIPILIVILTLGWFIIANLVLIPMFSLAGSDIHSYRYQRLGGSLGNILLTILTRPDVVIRYAFEGDKLFYWMRLTMPTAFTALLDPLTLLMALPALMINTLSSYPPTYQLDRYHSSAPIVPYIVVASIHGLYRLFSFIKLHLRHVPPTFLQKVLLVMVLIVTLGYQTKFGYTPIGHNFKWPTVTEHHHQATTMLAQIPVDAVVAAENNLAPRLTQREWILIPPLIPMHHPPIDYLALDLRGNLDLYKSREQYCNQLQEYLRNPDYGLIYANDGLLLFKRGAPNTAIFAPMEPCVW